MNAGHVTLTTLALLGWAALPDGKAQAVPSTVQPSPAEQAIIDQRIAEIPDPQERQAVRSQGLPWLMTTFLCQDAARSVLVKLGSDPHRFFLQNGKPDSQKAVSPSLLEGSGQYLHAGAQGFRWTSFSWVCRLDPAIGRVVNFSATPGAEVAPGP